MKLLLTLTVLWLVSLFAVMVAPTSSLSGLGGAYLLVYGTAAYIITLVIVGFIKTAASFCRALDGDNTGAPPAPMDKLRPSWMGKPSARENAPGTVPLVPRKGR